MVALCLPRCLPPSTYYIAGAIKWGPGLIILCQNYLEGIRASPFRVITHSHFFAAQIGLRRVISARPLARESNL